MKNQKLIVTIGRQYGSGGHEVGEKLAQKLGVELYDKNILRMNSDESGIKESYFHLADERPGNRLLYRIISSLKPEDTEPSFGSDMISADNLFRFQSDVIRKLADEESCVIIGRCAGYVLDGEKDLVRIFIYSDMGKRIQRITEKEYYAPEDVEKNIKRIDRERREYYRYYTGKEWGNPENYDLLINTSKLGVDKTVEVIADYLREAGYEV